MVVLQPAGHAGRLNRAFEGFFRRVKAGASQAIRGSKARRRFESVEWPKDGDGARWHPDTRRVYLQGVGQVKVTARRDVLGRVKTIQVRREGRRWMLILSCDDVPATPMPATGRQVGVDVGITSFATTSDGDHVPNPRWARTAAARLSAAQQRLARTERGSNNGVADVRWWLRDTARSPTAAATFTTKPPAPSVADL